MCYAIWRVIYVSSDLILATILQIEIFIMPSLRTRTLGLKGVGPRRASTKLEFPALLCLT